MLSEATVEHRRSNKTDTVLRRALWLLDRLLPSDAGDVFLEFADEPALVPRAYYAWGRRLPGDQRHRILELSIRPKDPYNTEQAMFLAWTESCPDTELSQLLDWVGIWEPILEPRKASWLRTPEEDVAKRIPDRERCLAVLLEQLERLVERLDGPNRSQYETDSAARILRLLLKSAASQVPPRCRKDRPDDPCGGSARSYPRTASIAGTLF